MCTGRPVVAAAPAAPAPEAVPASAVAAAGCAMSWPRSSAGAWMNCVGLMDCCRGEKGMIGEDKREGRGSIRKMR